MLTHNLSLVQVQVWAVLSLGPVRIKCNVVCELERTVQLYLLFPQNLDLRDFIATFKKSVYHSSCWYHWEIIKAWSGLGLALIAVIEKNDKKKKQLMSIIRPISILHTTIESVSYTWWWSRMKCLSFDSSFLDCLWEGRICHRYDQANCSLNVVGETVPTGELFTSSDNEKTHNMRVGLLYISNLSNTRPLGCLRGALYSFSSHVSQVTHLKGRGQKAMGLSLGKDTWGLRWNVCLATRPVVGTGMKLKSSLQAENSWLGRKITGPNIGANLDRFGQRKAQGDHNNTISLIKRAFHEPGAVLGSLQVLFNSWNTER